MIVVHRVEITVLDIEFSQLQILRHSDLFKKTVELDFGQFGSAQVHGRDGADSLAQWRGRHPGQTVLTQIKFGDAHLYLGERMFLENVIMVKLWIEKVEDLSR